MTATDDVFEIALRWGDMDALGHINNVQIARLFEQARVECFNSWFGDARKGIHLLVARQEIEYRAILHYSTDPVRIACSISDIGRSSFEFGYQLLDAAGAVCAIAETTVVIMTREGRPTPIPDDVRPILDEHKGEPVPFRRRSGTGK
ncbi:MAG: thioesterase family protein [Gordonia sp. (in: high G+C Gram-positive bacteria)]|uniref:acyl-CoA thioesterase n=1 Tax=Gordonia sp. (in: high G+C Gram-positive bacteria) TaxID=84139 RepID=UPI0039E4AEC5